MTSPAPAGLAHSIQTRLRNAARETGRPHAELLALYAVERLLHRLGRSKHREQFLLKGAMLLRAWLGADARPTRDIDLLGPSDLDAPALLRALVEIQSAEVENDAITFDPDSIVVQPIRIGSAVPGLRARFDASLGPVRLRYQVDVGLGDAVYPPAVEVVPGRLLGLPVASVRACTPYTTVAEKLESIVVLGDANSRTKDYYDLVQLPRMLVFEGLLLAESIRRTFARRATAIPTTQPEGLSDGFAASPLHATRWRSFLAKGQLHVDEADLPGVVAAIRRFAEPALGAAREGLPFACRWEPGGPWR